MEFRCSGSAGPFDELDISCYLRQMHMLDGSEYPLEFASNHSLVLTFALCLNLAYFWLSQSRYTCTSTTPFFDFSETTLNTTHTVFNFLERSLSVCFVCKLMDGKARWMAMMVTRLTT